MSLCVEVAMSQTNLPTPIERTIASCETSGSRSKNHFAGVGRVVEIGFASQREAAGVRAHAIHTQK